MSKMKRAERDEWVAALRSGKYKQGHTALESSEKFCCLGVKCDLDIDAGRHGVSRTVYRDSDRVYAYYIDSAEDAAAYMPVQEILGAWHLSEDDARTLSDMNDRGQSFAVIAQWIEDNIPVEE